MHAFARETRLSETTFVQTATEDGADYRTRIWMSSRELPFAGHPSLGTAVAVARACGEREVGYVQQTGAGLQPIDVTVDGERGSASMLQEPPQFGAEVPAGDALAALGLDAGAAGAVGPPQVVSTGVPHLMLPVAPEALAHVRPEAGALPALLERTGAICLYPFAWEDGGSESFSRSFFIDVAGISEDPATGSAGGPLIAYLHERAGVHAVDVHQGVEMGRRSLLRCAIEGDRVRVGGDVVVVADGSVTL